MTPRRQPVHVTREARVPDPVRLARYRHAPEVGVRPLFFSGGTALREMSRRLVDYTHHSIHLITPFDSGGSSAALRKAFAMPAVGDLRNRLMALADRTVLGHPEIYSLFSYRFPRDTAPAALRARLRRMARGQDDQVLKIPGPLRSLVQDHLAFFLQTMPQDFDLRGANIGNLVLAGGYLTHRRNLDSVLFLFSQLVEARGVVRPVLDENLHLGVRLTDGSRIVGQHRITKAELLAPTRVEDVFLLPSLRGRKPVRPMAPEPVLELIDSADLICYPIGSFVTSLLATLLPAGIADGVSRVQVPKVYVPNPGGDSEEAGMSLPDKVGALLRCLRRGAARRVTTESLLHFVLIDPEAADVRHSEIQATERLGVKVIRTALATEGGTRYDGTALAEAVLSFI